MTYTVNETITNNKIRARVLRALRAHNRAITAFHNRTDVDETEKNEKSLARAYDLQHSKLPVSRGALLQLCHNGISKVADAALDERRSWQNGESIEDSERGAKLAKDLFKLHDEMVNFQRLAASLKPETVEA